MCLRLHSRLFVLHRHRTPLVNVCLLLLFIFPSKYWFGSLECVYADVSMHGSIFRISLNQPESLVWQCLEHAFLLGTDMTIHNDRAIILKNEVNWKWLSQTVCPSHTRTHSTRKKAPHTKHTHTVLKSAVPCPNGPIIAGKFEQINKNEFVSKSFPMLFFLIMDITCKYGWSCLCS